MEVVLDKLYELQAFYEQCLTHADVRVKDWLLMNNLMPTLLFTALYLVSVWIGPKLMANREPFQLKWFINCYNGVLIVINAHICSQLLIWTTHQGYSYVCQPVKYTYEEGEMKIASALWWFYFSKLLEMLDTIIFILRKKNNQVSFLHVYHHATMFPIWWIGVKWVAGGQSFFGAMINSFIHVIMYSYYGMAALGPNFQKYLWWKKYLTKLQLTQFFVGMVYTMQTLLTGCDFPIWMQLAAFVYGITIIALFINFYVQAYLKGKPHIKIQFVTGIIHAAQSLVFGCDFPPWMHWALIIYAATILLLFLNFYFHAYLKSRHQKDTKVSNGTVCQNGSVKEAKKHK